MFLSPKKYLCSWVGKNEDFRLPEIQSLAELNNIKISFFEQSYLDLVKSLEQLEENDGALKKQNYELLTPFMEIGLSSDEDAIKLASRSILLRGIYELIAKGQTYEELFENLKQYPTQYLEEYGNEETSFRFYVDGYGKTISMKDQIEVINKFSFLPFKGKIDLKNPKLKFWVIEDVGPPVYHALRKQAHVHPSQLPTRNIFFLREVGIGNQDIIYEFSLKKRKYLGSTPMDPELSFLMANQGLARKGSLILDPFTGTGGILLAAAKFGSTVLGSELDIRTVTGVKEKKYFSHSSVKPQNNQNPSNLFTNFQQYSLEKNLCDICLMDNSCGAWKMDKPFLDAIISDPPYGIRAGARKIGFKPNPKRNASSAFRHTEDGVHLPVCTSYDIPEVLQDLLQLSASLLVIGGRLVYWLPTNDTFKESDVPVHECLELVSNSEQVITTHLRRRLITMKKIKHPSSFKIVRKVNEKVLTNIETTESHTTQLQPLSSISLSVSRFNTSPTSLERETQD